MVIISVSFSDGPKPPKEAENTVNAVTERSEASAATKSLATTTTTAPTQVWPPPTPVFVDKDVVFPTSSMKTEGNSALLSFIQSLTDTYLQNERSLQELVTDIIDLAVPQNRRFFHQWDGSTVQLHPSSPALRIYIEQCIMEACKDASSSSSSSSSSHHPLLTTATTTTTLHGHSLYSVPTASNDYDESGHWHGQQELVVHATLPRLPPWLMMGRVATYPPTTTSTTTTTTTKAAAAAALSVTAAAAKSRRRGLPAIALKRCTIQGGKTTSRPSPNAPRAKGKSTPKAVKKAALHPSRQSSSTKIDQGVGKRPSGRYMGRVHWCGKTRYLGMFDKEMEAMEFVKEAKALFNRRKSEVRNQADAARIVAEVKKLLWSRRGKKMADQVEDPYSSGNEDDSSDPDEDDGEDEDESPLGTNGTNNESTDGGSSDPFGPWNALAQFAAIASNAEEQEIDAPAFERNNSSKFPHAATLGTAAAGIDLGKTRSRSSSLLSPPSHRLMSDFSGTVRYDTEDDVESHEPTSSTNVDHPDNPVKKKRRISEKANDKTHGASGGDNSGVTVRRNGKFQAQLFYAGHSRYIGVFKTQDAARIALEVAKTYFDSHPTCSGEDVRKIWKEAQKLAKKTVQDLEASGLLGAKRSPPDEPPVQKLPPASPMLTTVQNTPKQGRKPSPPSARPRNPAKSKGERASCANRAARSKGGSNEKKRPSPDPPKKENSPLASAPVPDGKMYSPIVFSNCSSKNEPSVGSRTVAKRRRKTPAKREENLFDYKPPFPLSASSTKVKVPGPLWTGFMGENVWLPSRVSKVLSQRRGWQS